MVEPLPMRRILRHRAAHSYGAPAHDACRHLAVAIVGGRAGGASPAVLGRHPNRTRRSATRSGRCHSLPYVWVPSSNYTPVHLGDDSWRTFNGTAAHLALPRIVKPFTAEQRQPEQRFKLPALQTPARAKARPAWRATTPDPLQRYLPSIADHRQYLPVPRPQRRTCCTASSTQPPRHRIYTGYAGGSASATHPHAENTHV